jgi:H+/gluconate symporter-like permease
VGGVWSVAVALLTAIVALVMLNRSRLADLRASMDAGANASVLPVVSVASLVGFGAVIAALPAFETVRDWCCPSKAGPRLARRLDECARALTGSLPAG